MVDLEISNMKFHAASARTYRRLHIFAILFVAILFSTLAEAEAAGNEPSSAPDIAYALAGRALTEALQKGGYTLYFRHTSTDFAKLDGAVKRYDDCSTQRMLSDIGRAEAKTIGTAIRALQLPVGEGLASPYCRTMETATLMFGKVRRSLAVREGGENNYPALKKLLAKPVSPANTNRMIVGHGIPFRAIAGPPHLSEGEAAVLKPLGDRYVVVARIAVGDWAGLMEVALPRVKR